MIEKDIFQYLKENLRILIKVNNHAYSTTDRKLLRVELILEDEVISKDFIEVRDMVKLV